MKRGLCVLLTIFLFILSPVYSYAVSVTDLPDFVPSEAVPADVDIPEFYTRVENSAGLYIFMTADGAVYKRIYGNVDGVYGWFIAVGLDNTVRSSIPDADIDADRALYCASPWVYTGTTPAPTHAGLLAPIEGVRRVSTLFGIDFSSLFKLLGAVTVVICLVIVFSAGKKRSKSRH